MFIHKYTIIPTTITITKNTQAAQPIQQAILSPKIRSRKRAGTKKQELSTPLQPEEAVADPKPVALEPGIVRVLGSGGEHLGGADAVPADEVGGDGDRRAAVHILHELVEAVGGVREELAHAEDGVEGAGSFVHLNHQRKRLESERRYGSRGRESDRRAAALTAEIRL